ncbi:FLJ37770-like protein [Trichonephila clavipes]|nr:FLJ37770-like protein [Trichonephila clavipes]
MAIKVNCAHVFLSGLSVLSKCREGVQDDSFPDNLSSSNTDDSIKKIGSSFRLDRRLNIRGIAETVGIDKECVLQISHNYFGIQKVYAKMMPTILKFEQQEDRKNDCTKTL